VKRGRDLDMRSVRKQIYELNISEFPPVFAEYPGIAREGYGIAGDVADGFKCSEGIEESTQGFQPGAGRVEHQDAGILHILFENLPDEGVVEVGRSGIHTGQILLPENGDCLRIGFISQYLWASGLRDYFSEIA